MGNNLTQEEWSAFQSVYFPELDRCQWDAAETSGQSEQTAGGSRYSDGQNYRRLC